MPVHQLADMTWEEVRDLDRSRTVAVLPLGAIEAHGPHLPLGTDAIIAEAMARAAAPRIAVDGRSAVVLPTWAYTAAPFGAAFAGSLSPSPGGVTALLLDLARELTRHGFAALAIANAHLDPSHLGSLDELVAYARAESLLPVAWPNLTRKPWGTRLGDEFMSGACHAGRFESSIVMAARPELVRDDLRRGLAPNPASLSEAIRSRRRTFAEAGGPRAYFGWPADATAAEGAATIDTLGALLAEAVAGVLAPTGAA